MRDIYVFTGIVRKLLIGRECPKLTLFLNVTAPIRRTVPVTAIRETCFGFLRDECFMPPTTVLLSEVNLLRGWLLFHLCTVCTMSSTVSVAKFIRAL